MRKSIPLLDFDTFIGNQPPRLLFTIKKTLFSMKLRQTYKINWKVLKHQHSINKKKKKLFIFQHLRECIILNCSIAWRNYGESRQLGSTSSHIPSLIISSCKNRSEAGRVLQTSSKFSRPQVIVNDFLKGRRG